MFNIIKIVFIFYIWLFSSWIIAQDMNFKVSYQIYENDQLLTFFGLYDTDDQLVDDISIEQLGIEFNSKIARPNTLSKFSSDIYGTSYLFLVDTSKSISSKNFSVIKQSISQWVENLGYADMAAIVAFGDSVKIIHEFSFDKSSLQESIKSIERDSMNTRYVDALSASYELFTENNTTIPYRRAVVTLTDGLDDPDLSLTNRLTYKEVSSLIQQSMVPYYMIGFAERSSAKKIEAIKEMKTLASLTNGFFLNANILGIDNAFKKTKSSIENVYFLKSSCFACDLDFSNFYSTLYLDYKNIQYSQSQTVFVNDALTESVLDETDFSNEVPLYAKILENIYTVSLLGFLLIMIFLWFLFYRKSSKDLAFDDHESVDLGFEAQEINLQTGTQIQSQTRPKFTLKLEYFSKKPSKVIEDNFRESIILGRSSKADIVLKDYQDISGMHAKIYSQGDYLLIDDLGSTNHTFLNGARVYAKCPIRNGDLLKLGIHEFKIFIKNYEDLTYE